MCVWGGGTGLCRMYMAVRMALHDEHVINTAVEATDVPKVTADGLMPSSAVCDNPRCMKHHAMLLYGAGDGGGPCPQCADAAAAARRVL